MGYTNLLYKGIHNPTLQGAAQPYYTRGHSTLLPSPNFTKFRRKSSLFVKCLALSRKFRARNLEKFPKSTRNFANEFQDTLSNSIYLAKFRETSKNFEPRNEKLREMSRNFQETFKKMRETPRNFLNRREISRINFPLDD